MSGFIGKLTKATLAFTDKRLRLVGEEVDRDVPAVMCNVIPCAVRRGARGWRPAAEVLRLGRGLLVRRDAWAPRARIRCRTSVQCTCALCRARVEVTRADELREKRRVACVSAVNTAIIYVGPMVLALLTFVVYGYTSKTPLDAGTAFTALSLFSILRVPLAVLPMVVATIASGKAVRVSVVHSNG
jgi:hypothetical protein